MGVGWLCAATWDKCAKFAVSLYVAPCSSLPAFPTRCRTRFVFSQSDFFSLSPPTPRVSVYLSIFIYLYLSPSLSHTHSFSPFLPPSAPTLPAPSSVPLLPAGVLGVPI